jgi:hypothetical protein
MVEGRTLKERRRRVSCLELDLQRWVLGGDVLAERGVPEEMACVEKELEIEENGCFGWCPCDFVGRWLFLWVGRRLTCPLESGLFGADVGRFG